MSLDKAVKRKISNIIVPAGRRCIDHAKVLALAESIKIVDLLNPITVNKSNVLIAGGHRLEAHKLLGRKTIECIVLAGDEWKAELAEIDENLIRNDLDAIGIGELAIQRDAILDAQGLRKKPHGNGSNQHQSKGAKSAPLRTTQDIADEIGISKRTLKENKQLARDLTVKAKEAVRKVDATKQDALRLARKSHEEQDAAAGKILDGMAVTVMDALHEAARNKVRAK